MTEITRTYYTITYDPSIDEDGFVDISVYLGTGISSDVTLSFTAGENVFFDGQSSGSLTFTPDELGSTHTKSIRVSLTDDLTISYDQLASISVAFSSADAGPNGESEQIDLSITDNDFQRSIDLTKLPSDGHNKIIYDLDTSANNQWYTTLQAPQSNGQSTASSGYRSQQHHLYKYDLGSGNDDLEVSSGTQTRIENQNIVFYGGSATDHDDRIAYVNLADGGAGNDTLIASTVERNASFEVRYYNTTTDFGIYQHKNANILYGGEGQDTITGSEFEDFLIGGLGSDTITGAAGDDTLYGDGWSYIEWGFGLNAGDLWNRQGSYGTQLSRTVGGDDIIDGGDGDDTINAGAGNDTITVSSGNNHITAGLGADTITAGDGNDTIRGGDGSLNPGVDAADTINAGAGDDLIHGEGGDDIIYTEGGDDTAHGSDGDDKIYGAEGSDILNGDAGDDILDGGIGADILRGGIGADTLTGGDGNDELYGDDQNDIIDGGDGNNTIDGGEGDDTITAGTGVDTITAGAGDDTINAGDGNDIIDAGDGDDTITAGTGADTITAGTGNDTITAGTGDDTITAGTGDDIINAGDGDDTITAGTGADTITGGAGTDRFIFNYEDFMDGKIDVITDFTTGDGGDVLDLTHLHENNSEREAFGGAWPYSHGYIQFTIDGDDTLVSYDQDGWYDNYSAQSFIRLSGVNLTSLAAVNVNPDPNDELYAISTIVPLSEDSNATVSYQIILGKEPTDDVIVTIAGGDQINVNGSSQPINITFNADNWYIPQTVSITAIDDLIIERNHTVPLTHSFSSADTDFNNLPDTVRTVSITDNDFQRSIDQSKLPSDGHNKIIYDLDTSANNQWYTTLQAPQSNGQSPHSTGYRSQEHHLYKYDLGSGNDDLEVSSGTQTRIENQNIVFYGGSATDHDDRIAYVNLADGGAGNDTLIASTVERNASFEVRYYNTTTDFGIYQHKNANILYGGEGQDTITGSEFEDFLIGGLGSDTITGAAGDDTLYGDGWSYIEWGFGLNAGDLWNRQGSYGTQLSRTVGGDDIIDGGDGDDTINAGAGNDTITVSSGNNHITAGLGADTITAGDGNDTIRGGDGSLNPGVDAADTINAGAGDDLIHGEGGDDIIYTEGGDDTAHGSDGDDKIYGAEGSDILNGDAGDDILDGGIGADILRGGIGADTLTGGDGNDELYGDDQNDIIDGGDGNNTIDGGEGDDTITAGTGDDTITAGAGDDTINAGDGNDIIDAGDGDDTITAGTGADTITAGTGNDTITAGTGDDTITAGTGDDIINAGDGDDTITAGTGADTITGGAGTDRFIFNYEDFMDGKIDVITDFTTGDGGDVLDLTHLHENNSEREAFGGAWPYSHGYIQFTIDGDDTLVSYDQDGWYDNYSAQSFIRLSGVNLTSLAAVNVNPDPNDELYAISTIVPLSEDSNATVSYQIILGKEPTDDVIVTIAGGDQINVNGSSQPINITFNADNWYIPQTVSITAIDDLIIERNHTVPLTHSFSSADTDFNNLPDTVRTVSITDNDFQRSIDQSKLPSDGHNKIIYDLDTSANNQWYTTLQAPQSNGQSPHSTGYRSQEHHLYKYDLGSGNDDLEVSSGTQTRIENQNIVFYGGSATDHDDRIAYVNLADGGAGNDTLIASTVERNASFEVRYYNTTTDFGIYQHKNANILYGGEGQDTITGSEFEDFLIGGLGSDTITGAAGDDTLYGDGWSYIEWGFGLNAGDLWNRQGSYGTQLSRTVGGDDIIDGGDGDDTINAGAGNDTITVSSGNNHITAGLGADTITAGDGNDTIRGGDGSLNPGVDAADTINAGAGDDLIHGEGGDDIIYTEGGDDTAHGSDGDDKIYGAEGSDILNGDAGDDILDGGIGADILRGGIGADTLTGGDGNDELYGDDQNDIIDGGDGNNTIDGGEGDDTITAGTGDDTITAGAGDDTINAGDGNDIIDAGDGDDTITAGTGADTITAGTGNDTITAGTGDDTITAGTGDDIINAGDGDDTITAGTGADTITGGAGTDRFIFNYEDFMDGKIDVITDFTTGDGGDVLDLTHLHENNSEREAFGGAWPYSHGYIQFTIDGDDTLVSYDQDGWYDNYSAQSFIRLSGVNLTSLAAVNVNPDPNDELYAISTIVPLSEDSNATVSYQIILGKEPTDDVIVTIAGGDQINVNGSSQPINITFNADNWYIPQTVSITAIDDLIIERNHTVPLTHSFSSADTDFNNLPDTVRTVSITDNDFQRSIDQSKLPSDGHNKIIYDLDTSANNQWYTTLQAPQSNGQSPHSTGYRSQEHHLYKYDLGSGNDDLEVSSGTQTRIENQNIVFYGGSATDHDDRIAYVNLADGGAGNDTLIASTVERNASFEVRYYNTTTDFGIYQHKNANILYGGEGQDTITGSEFEDFLIGGLGSDTITGAAGDDTLYGDGWSYIEWGFGLNAGDLWNRQGSYGTQLSRTVGGDDIIDGGDGDDTINAGAGNDTITVSSGNNHITAGLGADTITAGDGNDTIRGGDGSLNPGVDAADTINAGAGDDLIHGEGGDDIIYTEGGDDTAHGSDGDDKIYGAEGSDILNGDAGDDILDGGIGADILRGGIGADTLTGGDGNDELYGDDQNDIIDGGDGNNTIDGGEGDDTITAGTGVDTITAGAGDDTINAGDGNDIIDAGDGDDTITAGTGADTITAGTGNDTITAGTGDDTITAGTGDDIINAGDGDDTITAGTGADTITGGAGTDRFIFNYEDFMDGKIDVITDFTTGDGGDVLDLTQMHNGSIAANGANSGQEIYPYSLGFIRFIESGDDTVVAYDIDGPDIDNQANTVAILKDISPLELTKENLSVEGTNFGIFRSGVISSISETDTNVLVNVRLWGGQPSADVSVSVTLANTSELSQDLTFAPGEWMSTKTLTFAKGSSFSASDINNIAMVLSSADLNFDAEVLRFKAEQSGAKSTFLIGQAENQSNDNHFAFEKTSDLSIDQLISDSLPQNVQFTASSDSKYFTVAQTASGLALRAGADAPTGLHNISVTFTDENFNTTTRALTVEIFPENVAPAVTIAEDLVVTTTKPFSEIALDDDGLIASLTITLGSGYSSSVAAAIENSYTGSLSFVWDSSARTVTLSGNGNAAAYSSALDKITVTDNGSTEARHTFEMSIVDVASNSDFIKTTTQELNYFEGVTLTPSVETWNGVAISNASLFGLGHGDTNKLMNVSNLDLGKSVVTFDVLAAADSVGVFDFGLDLTSNFELTASSFASTLTDNNYITADNLDTANNIAYFTALNSGESIASGDKLVSVTLAYTGSGNIKSDLGDIAFTQIDLGGTQQSNIALIGTESVSSSAGLFSDVPMIEGDTVFVLEKDTSDIGNAVTSFDAYLAQKIAVLIEGQNTIDGLNIEQEQIIAADINQNGRVNSMDVYAILQEAINIENDSAPEWVFMDAGADLSAINRNNSTYDDYINEIVSFDSNIDFTGILIGDVNGSWIA